MSTNFYFKTSPTGGLKHIGKANNHGISTFQGEEFGTLAEVREALLTPGIAIEDEYGVEHAPAEFVATMIDGFNRVAALYNIGWHHGARTPMGESRADGHAYWVEPGTGALFYSGEFF